MRNSALLPHEAIIGIFYETPEGEIAYAFGFDSVRETISYRFDDGVPFRHVAYTELRKWTPRYDLRDFPNTKDPQNPRLPYEFDLHWDIKYLSDAKKAIDSGHPEAEEIQRLLLLYYKDQVASETKVSEKTNEKAGPRVR